MNRLYMALAGLLVLAAPAMAASDRLVTGFVDPPTEARPRVWWHWMDGNVTREGIELDLAWMKRSGIAGFTVFDVAPPTPAVVEHRLVYMTPEWKQAFRHAIRTATNLGLEASIASSPGWSETGGPWVRPEQAMKKLVWSETEVPEGRAIVGALPMPPANAGPFHDLPHVAPEPANAPAQPFYRDIAVIAFPTPPDATETPSPRITSSKGSVDAATLAAPSLDREPVLTLAGDTPQYVRFDYPQPVTVRSLVMALRPLGRFVVGPVAILEASNDDDNYQIVAEVPAGAFRQNTISFAPVTARSFRVSFMPPADDGPFWKRVRNAAAPGINPPFRLGPPKGEIGVIRLCLLSEARVHRFEEKAGFASTPDYYALATPATGAGSAVPSDEVVDLSAALRPDGTLDWEPPPGRWTVLRLGYSLTGQTNGPAPAESVGYEVDKLNVAHVADYMAHYLKSYKETLGPDQFGGRGVSGILTDSYEAGLQNWTDDMIDEFTRLRGYDPRPFLPALAGWIVSDAAASDRFLWDFRATIADLLAANHYGQVARSAHDTGLVVYGEALENERPVLGDDMAMRSHADIPMGAAWALGQNPRIEPMAIVDLKGASSVAHVWGRPFVAMESFTSALSPWTGSPRSLKSIADAALALGVTRFFIHSTVHQPVVDKVPGMTLGIFGQYFNRNETWAEQARPWTDYLARNSFLLRQGHYQADIAYFYGQEAPLTSLYGYSPVADIPDGYGFDFVDGDALIDLLSTKNGVVSTPSGMQYRILQLGGSSQRMTLAALQKVDFLVQAGAVVVGSKPVGSPSLADDPAVFHQLADALWSTPANAAGGRVIDRSAAEALCELGVAPDWQAMSPEAPPLMVIHRVLDRGSIYFLSNQSHRAAQVEISFRITGYVPELWDADAGTQAPLPYRIEDGRTIVPIAFDPDGSALIVFRSAEGVRSTPVDMVEEVVFSLSGGWTLSFQPGRGAPEGALRMSTGSWSASDIPGIRYFSGTGTYERSIDIPSATLADGERLILDLGEVAELVDIAVNGHTLRTLWKPPYRLDITDALKPGHNDIALRVTNLWVNRLIGDAQPGAATITFTGAPTYAADAPLRSSGLIGPVRLTRLSPRTRP